MRLSILVVSRTAGLVSRMLGALKDALHLPSDQVEVLCSWNGNSAEEDRIENLSGYEFLIANRSPYHFASNMNSLAEKANGEVLLLINDDVILDSHSLDAALSCLSDQPKTGLVGARLYDSEGRLTHAGILFDRRHNPYHQLDRLVSADHHGVLGDPRPIPATTGAAMVIRREHFQALGFNTNYKVCGEDVELCLAVREHLRLNVIYCPRFSGEHSGEATRSEEKSQGGNSEDLTRMRGLHKRFLNSACRDQLKIELAASVIEADVLRSTILAQFKNMHHSHWEDQTHALQLERLKLKQKLKQTERGA
ncbi:glycosyltransferase [Synechococcus sp. N26]|uniref:glycosyltransferase n=1 Tax=Synechococcus sp. N26 TaxID=2575513 RepID=UPI000E0FF0E7|nr:glycosyltransferase [Synechococcus sp. N26]